MKIYSAVICNGAYRTLIHIFLLGGNRMEAYKENNTSKS